MKRRHECCCAAVIDVNDVLYYIRVETYLLLDIIRIAHHSLVLTTAELQIVDFKVDHRHPASPTEHCVLLWHGGKQPLWSATFYIRI